MYFFIVKLFVIKNNRIKWLFHSGFMSPTESGNEECQSPEDQEAANRLCSSLVNLPTFVRNGEKVPLEVLEKLTTHRQLYTLLMQNYPSLLISSRSFSDSGCLHEQVRNHHSWIVLFIFNVFILLLQLTVRTFL